MTNRRETSVLLRFTFPLVLLATVSCSGSNGKANDPWDASQETTPATASAPREKPAKKRKFTSPGGEWSGAVQSVEPPSLEVAEWGWEFSAKIARDQSFDCSIAPESLDVGGTIAATLQNIQEPFKVTGVSIFAFDHHETAPLLFVRTLVSAGGKKGTRAKVLSLIGVRDHASVSCSSDSIVDEDLFRKATTDFFTSFEFKEPRVARLRSELWSMKSGNEFTGYAQIGLQEGEDGRFLSGLTTVEFGGENGRIEAIREASTTYVLASDGSVLQGVFTSTDNGEDGLSATLTKSAAGYEVKGDDHGQPFETKFKTTKTLVHELDLRRNVRAMAAQKSKKSFAREEYNPWVVKEKANKIAYQFVPSATGFELTGTMGPLSLIYGGPADGSVTTLTIRNGSAAVEAKLEAETGSFFPEK